VKKKVLIKSTNKDLISKTELAKILGISRASLYYEKVQPIKDWRLKCQIEKVLRKFPSYGHRRIALHLGKNKKPVLRVMKIFGIKPKRRRRKPKFKAKNSHQVYPNLLIKKYNVPESANHIWASDFTYLWFKDQWIYLATVLDLFTREIVGFNVLTNHTADLVSNALLHAAITRPAVPQILHSDQGSEYASQEYTSLVKSLGIQQSMSRKASPWENGYQEGFYSQFKLDLGDPSRFDNLGELTYNIYRAIYSYNNHRIHTALKMSPAQFANKHN